MEKIWEENEKNEPSEKRQNNIRKVELADEKRRACSSVFWKAQKYFGE